MPDLPRLSVANERATLWVLAAVQFTHILDFMIMLPMGDRLMRTFAISPKEFSHLAMSYGLAAAITGLAGGALIDRFERKRALLFLYAGFTLATLACALAPDAKWLLIARCLCGAFGGVAGSMVGAMVGDVVPAERRGRGMGVVMTAFPLASVLGVPLGLFLCNRYDWHAPFYFLAAVGAAVWLVALKVLPVIPAHPSTDHPWRQLWEIVSRRTHVLGLTMSGLMVLGGSVVVSFLAPSFVANVGIEEARLPWVYATGGVATFLCTPIIGRLSDRFDKLAVLAGVSVLMGGGAPRDASAARGAVGGGAGDRVVYGGFVGAFCAGDVDAHDRGGGALSRGIYECERGDAARCGGAR